MIDPLKRIAWALWSTAVVAVSLMTFPHAIPWLIAFWLAWHSWSVGRGRPGYLPLAVCVAVLVVKRVAISPELVAMVSLMAVVGIVAFVERKALTLRTKRAALAGVIALWGMWGLLAWGWYAASHGGRPVTLEGTRPVACLGDSLTAGEVGGSGYPNELRRRITLPVLDFSRPGIDTREALKSLPAILEARPQVVIVELGGHDYLKGYGRASTRQNLEKIITACRAIDAEVVLMEVPRGLIVDPFWGLERGLARQYDLELIPDTPIRQLVFWSPHVPPGMWTRGPHLSDDGLHPNAQGNRLLAERVAGVLARLYGPEIRANDRQ
jgi:lysophospholipase L1-like esterase